MKVKLVSTDCFAPVLDLTIDRLPSIIGCGTRADVRLTDRGVGARHCELLVCDGALLVRPLNQKHNILVNGQPVADAVLESGDTLTVGIRSLQVTCWTHDGWADAAADEAEFRDDDELPAGRTLPPKVATELHESASR